MNLNDFVVLPNNKAKSVKLNVRHLQELQMQTVTLAEERNEMEEKLLQLKESMSKEKKERGHSGGFRWKSGQHGSLTSDAITNSSKTKESRLQKLSASKLKIRVLKDEPLTAQPQRLPSTQASTTGPQTTSKTRLKGTVCGQCEVRTAGLLCTECSENYCVGCFARFHQKGALKLHKMIPIKTNLQTHVSTPDVISSFQKQIDHSLYPSTLSNLIPSPNFKPRPQPHHTFTARECDQSPKRGIEDVVKLRPSPPNPSQVLVFNGGEEKKLEMTEEEKKRKDEEEIPTSLLSGEYSEEESARSFQEALRQWRGKNSDASGETTREGTMWIPVRPVSMSAIATQVDLPQEKVPEGGVCGEEVGRIPVVVEFKENSLTYMDRLLLKRHRRTPVEAYPTSLGIIGGLKSNIDDEEETTNSLTAQEEEFHHYYASLFAVSASSGRVEPLSTTPGSCLVIETLDETDRYINGSFGDVQATEDNKVVPPLQQTSSSGTTLLSQTTLSSVMPYKGKPSACPTADTPRTSTSSSKTPTSKSQKTNFSPAVHKSNADHGSLQALSSRSLPQFQAEIPKFSPSRSHSVSLFQKGSDSSGLLEPTHSSQLPLGPVSSIKLSQSTSATLEFPPQFQHSLSVPVQHPLSLMPLKPNPNPKSLEPTPPVNTPPDVSAFTDSPLDTFSRYKSASTYVDIPSAESQDEHCVSTHVIQNPPSAMTDELSFDHGDEISSDCLGLALHKEDSSDEEPQMLRYVTGGRSRGEEQGSPAKSHLGDSFVPADAEREEDFQTDEPEHLSEPSMVLHNQSAGSGSELLCDLHEFTPLGLDMDCGHSDTPGYTHSDPLLTCQASLPESNQTNMLPAFRPLSRAAQEIMEICTVDQTGCEDPDLDTDATAHTLHSLEQELRRLANVSEIAAAASVFGAVNSGSRDQRGNLNFSWGRVSEEQNDEEEAAQRDMQSVLFLS